MPWELPENERSYLRDLAHKQAEYAALPVMDDRKQMWYDLNDAKPGARPPFVIETGTFNRDFLPMSLLQCTTDRTRLIEAQLLANIRKHELIDDDTVVPDTFDINWSINVNEFGVPIEQKKVKDAQGIECGYEFLHPIKDLERDFEKLKPATFGVDRDGTLAYQEFLNDLLGDFLPVEIRPGYFHGMMLTQNVVMLMGMQAFFMAMYTEPDAMHRLMAYLRDNALSIMKWREAEGLLTLNNGNHFAGWSSYAFTNKLPKPGGNPGHVRLCDLWVNSNSQETVGVSPELFHEFCFPYYRDICEPFGQVYFGCCEPADAFWDDISQLPHLKKISISRWCDEATIAEALRGTEIVFSRKPDPKFLGIDVELDEDGWRAHVRATLDATRDVFTEFVVRDVYTVHGNLGKPRRATEIAREEIDKFF